jgi:hypothetical protein
MINWALRRQVIRRRSPFANIERFVFLQSAIEAYAPTSEVMTGPGLLMRFSFCVI